MNANPPVLDRAAFLSRLHGHTSRAGSPLTVLVVADIRQMNLINGRCGYEAGDRLLGRVGERIAAALRTDDVLGHLGGGSFGVLLTRLASADVARLALHKIDKALEPPIRLAGEEVRIRLGYGLACFPDDASDADRLLHRAETALAGLRGQGAHSAFFDKRIHDVVETSNVLVTELEQAMESQQLELYYQPKIDLQGGGVAGAEALVRWNHPQRGLVGPFGFMPQMESSPLIAPFTEWCLNVALYNATQLDCHCTGLRMAVNLSANVLYQPELVHHVESAMAIWSMPAERLVLEVTESAMMRDPESSMATLRRLADMGVTISIDDFGTGYSSLAYLKHLPVGELKIDKSFIMQMLEHPEDRQIVQSVIDLAHNLKLDVVAEGVESEEAARELAGMGCDIAQGYFFARPMPQGALEAWLKSSEWSCRNSVHDEAPGAGTQG